MTRAPLINRQRLTGGELNNAGPKNTETRQKSLQKDNFHRGGPKALGSRKQSVDSIQNGSDVKTADNIGQIQNQMRERRNQCEKFTFDLKKQIDS